MGGRYSWAETMRLTIRHLWTDHFEVLDKTAKLKPTWQKCVTTFSKTILSTFFNSHIGRFEIKFYLAKVQSSFCSWLINNEITHFRLSCGLTTSNIAPTDEHFQSHDNSLETTKVGQIYHKFIICFFWFKYVRMFQTKCTHTRYYNLEHMKLVEPF